LAGVAWDYQTADWLGKIDDVLYGKLTAKGLVPPRATEKDKKPVTLGEFIAYYIESRTDVKPNTKSNYEQLRTWLLKFFGPDKLLSDVSAGDAIEFRRFLSQANLLRDKSQTRMLSDNTVSRGALEPASPGRVDTSQ
jgi:hypothetical protein